MILAGAAGIYAKGGHTGTCKGIFSKCMGAYHLNEDGQRLLQGIVPDGFLDAQGCGGPADSQLFLNTNPCITFDFCSGTGPTSPTPIMAGRA